MTEQGSGTPAYDRFRRAFFGPHHRDGPDVGVLDELTPGERQRAEQELLAHLGKSLAVTQGLSHLRSRAAVDPLRAMMRSQRGLRAVGAAGALWTITEDAEALGALCRAVAHRPLLGRGAGRVDAAAMLARIERPEALATLIEVLDDRDSAVRGHAMQAVAQRLRFNAEADALRSGQLTMAEFQRLARAALIAGERP